MERIIRASRQVLADMREGDRCEVVFQVDSPEDYDRLVGWHAPCGCATPRYDRRAGRLAIRFEAQAVPEHLREQGWYEPIKRIDVQFVGHDGRPRMQQVEFQVRISRR